MIIRFDLPHVYRPGANPRENAYALRALMGALINLDYLYLRMHPNTPELYRSGVTYGRTQTWDTIPALYGKKYGDCKSLTAALIAERRMHGIPASPVFRFAQNWTGGEDYHILVMNQDGSCEDPSKRLGMGNEADHFRQNNNLTIDVDG